MKSQVHLVLRQSLGAKDLRCEAFADGMTVRVDEATAFEPDALIQCGERLADDAITASAPILVVEVLSPSTKQVDTGKKLEGYFRVPSIVHFLILDPESRLVIHHRRGDADVIQTRMLTSGTLELDPPGLTVAVAELFAAA